jgi:hypothetical protein
MQVIQCRNVQGSSHINVQASILASSGLTSGPEIGGG